MWGAYGDSQGPSTAEVGAKPLASHRAKIAACAIGTGLITRIVEAVKTRC
jgi:hypothetical protein